MAWAPAGVRASRGVALDVPWPRRGRGVRHAPAGPAAARWRTTERRTRRTARRCPAASMGSGMKSPVLSAPPAPERGSRILLATTLAAFVVVGTLAVLDQLGPLFLAAFG